MRLFLKKFFFKNSIVLFLLAGMFITTCNNPVGLGPRVELPTGGPAISIDSENGPGPGEFISGIETIYINAESETGVESVTATLIYSIFGEDGKLVKVRDPNPVPAYWDEETQRWAVDVDTSSMADGLLEIIIEAEDNAGNKTTTPELIYTVKNNHVLLNMLIPRADPAIDRITDYGKEDFKDILYNAVAGSFLMGIFEDLAGIAALNPQIKFWKDGNDEPGTNGTDFTANAGWEGVTSAKGDAGDGWIWVYANDASIDPESSAVKGGSFRYDLRKRDAQGNVVEEILELGDYKLKLRAIDVVARETERYTEWPKDAYKDAPEFMTIELIESEVPPRVEIIEPTVMFQRGDFDITARAISRDPASAVTGMRLTVLQAGDEVLLESWDAAEVAFGASVTHTVDTSSFTNGNYTFTVTAYGGTDAKEDAYLNVTIDTVPPETNISSVYSSQNPNRSAVENTPSAQDNPANDVPYRRFTVNNTIQINSNSLDANGNALDEDGNVKFKYLFLLDDSAGDGGDFGEFLYDHADAVLFDETMETPNRDFPTGVDPNSNPLVAVEFKNGVYTLTLQTHKYNPADKYLLWMYIVSMDRAGNIGYSKILLHVDQETDKPEIQHSIADDSSVYLSDNSLIQLTVTDDNGLSADSIEFRFDSNDAAKDNLQDYPEIVWHPLPAAPSLDGLSINIQDLNLSQIETIVGSLGSEAELKWIQFRALDNANTKFYPDTDGRAVSTVAWSSFRIDRTAPVIVVSSTDNKGSSITRQEDNPFIEPQRGLAYNELDFAYGDVIEYNLKSITLRINGIVAEVFEVQLPMPESEPAEPGFAVWQTNTANWIGDLRWRIPLETHFGNLPNGTHSFELSFEDRISNIAARTITFHKASIGPEIGIVNPANKYYLSDDNFEAIIRGDIDPIDLLEDVIITDTTARVMGNFSSDLAPIFSTTTPIIPNDRYWYKIDGVDNGAISAIVPWTWVKIDDANITDSKFVSWDIPLTGFDDGIYRVSLRVRDALGNGYAIENHGEPNEIDAAEDEGDIGPGFINKLTFMLDRSPPILTVDPMQNTYNANFSITGTIGGTYLVKSLELNINTGSKTVVRGTDVGDPLLIDAGVFPFEFPIDVVADLNPGNNTITISATGSSEQTATVTRTFVIDTTGPVISFNSTGGEIIKLETADWTSLNNALNTGTPIPSALQEVASKLFETSLNATSIVLNGNFADQDSNLGDSYSYRINNGTWTDVPITGTSMSTAWNIPLASITEGIHLLGLRVADILGNQSEETNIAFMVDRSIPEFEDLPATLGIYNDDFGISGKVVNTFNVKSLILSVNGGKEIADIVLGTDVNLPLSNTASTARSFDFSFTIPVDDLPEGSGTVTINAIGSSGQSAQMAVRNFIYDKTGPEISLITLGKAVQIDNTEYGIIFNGTIVPGSELADKDDEITLNNTISDDSGVLIGNFTDSFSPIASNFRYRLDVGALGESAWVPGSWETLQTGNPSGDPDGSRTIAWQIPIGTLSDGVHRISLEVTDFLGSQTLIENIGFKVERGTPVLTITSPAAEAFVTEAFNITGTVTDVGSVHLSARINNSIDVPSSAISHTGSGTSHTFTIAMDPIALGLDETRHTVLITAGTSGSNPKSDSQTISFTYDNTAPEVLYNMDKLYLSDAEMANILAGTMDTALQAKYNALADTSFRNAGASLAGNFSDALSEIYVTGNLGFWYKIDGINGVGWFADIDSWEWVDTSASTSRFVNWSIPLTDFDDGIYRLSLRVKDALGNGYDETDSPSGDSGPGFETNMAFRIDRGTPLLTIDDVPEVINADFVIEGKVENVFSVKSLSVRLDGTEMPDGTVTLTRTEGATPGTFIPWSFDLSISMALASGYLEKPYSLIITATGASDQSDTKMFSFTFDNTAPEITHNVEIIYFSDDDFAAINSGVLNSRPDLQADYNKLRDSSFKDANARLMGSFSDLLSAVYTDENDGYWYKIDGIIDNDIVTGEWIWEDDVVVSDSRFVNWSIPLTLDDYDDGIYRISIRIKDAAGNGHGITDANTSSQVDSAEGETDNSGPGFETNLAFRIDRGIPELEVDTQVPAFINSGITIEGTVSNTVSVTALNFRLNGVDLVEDLGGTVTIEPTVGEAKSFDYTAVIPATALTERSYSLIINTTGASGQSATEVRNFTFHKTAPELLFNTPSAGSLKFSGDMSDNGKYAIYWGDTWVTGQTRIGGTSDSAIGIEKIYYYLGRLGDDQAADDAAREAIYQPNNMDMWTDTFLESSTPAAGWSGGLYYWNFTENLNPFQFNAGMIEKGGGVLPQFIEAEANQFYLPMYVQIVDRAGNISLAQYKIFVDPDLDIPQATIANPDEGARVGGEIRVSGMANDNDWIHSVDIRISNMGSDGTFQNFYKNPTDEWAYSASEGWIKANIQGPRDVVVAWFYTINGDGLLNPEPGAMRYVKIEVRAVDTTGPADSDPKQAGSPAERNIIFLSEVPIITPPVVSKTGLDDRLYSDGIRVSGEFTLKTTIQDVGGLSSIRARQTGLSAYKEIVSNGRVVSGNLETGWSVTEPAEVYQDSWEAGWRYYILNAGGITNWEAIDNSWFEGKQYGAGVMIQLKYGAVPNGSGALAFRAEGTQAANDGDLTNWNTQHFTYRLAFDINSTALPNLGYGRSGMYTLELQAYNNNQVPGPYNTNASYSLAVDNFFPEANIETQYNAATSQFYVMGTAKDYSNTSGTIQGLERMLVYFQRGSQFYNASAVDITSAMTTRPNVMDRNAAPAAGDTEYIRPNVPSFANFPVISYNSSTQHWESSQAIVIGNYEGIRMVGGIVEEQWEGRVDREWMARLDTTNFADGPLTVHYVIIDLAGNATHYQERIYIGNYKPVIRAVNPGTDVGGNNIQHLVEDIDVFTENDEEITEMLEPNFRVRNNRFDLKLNTVLGNTRKTYRVSYVVPGAVTTSLVQGSVYTIETHEGHVDFRRFGAPNNNIGTTFVSSLDHTWITPTGDDPTTVRTYTMGPEVSDVFATHGVSTGDIATASFGSTHFGIGTGLIPDSTKTGGVITDRNQRRFMIKVYDQTVSGGSEADQLAHVVMIAVDIDNTDTLAPSITTAPFGEKYANAQNDAAKTSTVDVGNYNENLVTTWRNTAGVETYEQPSAGISTEIQKGYVQYADHTNSGTANAADISGKVIFMGKAADDQRINRITAQIGTNAQFDIALWNATQGRIVPVQTIEGMALDSASATWGFEVIDEYLTLDYGHVLNWKFAWDTSSIAGTAAENVTVTFRVFDGPPNPSTGVASPITVDIVPYISEVVTRLTGAFSRAPSAFNRSAQGWYPVQENEIITIRGFNLMDGTTPLVSLDGEELTPNTASGANTKTQIRVDVGEATSGPLVVSVNDVNSINNRNNKDYTTTVEGEKVFDALYNQEPNDVNNNILDNSRNLYVWRVGVLNSAAGFPYLNPVMRMDSSSNWYMAYGTSTTGQAINTVKNGTMTAGNGTATNRWRHTTVAYDAYGGLYTIGANQTANDVNYRFNYRLANNSGVLNGFSAVANLRDAGGDRFRIPRIATLPLDVELPEGVEQNSYNRSRVLVSYFDTLDNDNNRLYLHDGMAWTTATNGGTNNIDLGTAIVVTDNSRTRHGSMFTAVGYLSTGRPVVAWYDRTNMNLVLSGGNEPPNVTINVSGTQQATTTNTAITSRRGHNTAGTNNIDIPSGTRTYNVPSGNVFTLGEKVTVTWGGNVYNDLYVVWRGNQTNNSNTIALSSSATTPTVQSNFWEVATNATGLTITRLGMSINHTNTDTWLNNAITIQEAAGSHVDMVIDSDDNVHLAYYDVFNGGLYYALTTIRENGIPNPASIAKVDTYLSAGTRIMLNVRRENHGTSEVPIWRNVPYISYFHGSFDETRNSIRVAWRSDFTNPVVPADGTDDIDAFTGAWEVMTLPTVNVPASGELISNGVPSVAGTTFATTNTTGLAGYNGNDFTKTMLVGYMTTHNYEGAILKKDLW